MSRPKPAAAESLAQALARAHRAAVSDWEESRAHLDEMYRFVAATRAGSLARKDAKSRMEDAEYAHGVSEDRLLILDRRMNHGQAVVGAYRAALILRRQELDEAKADPVKEQQRRTLPRRIARMERKVNELTIGRSVE